MTSLQYIKAALTARWNALVPECALRVEEEGNHFKYLHPTKGWRKVSKRRFGFGG